MMNTISPSGSHLVRASNTAQSGKTVSSHEEIISGKWRRVSAKPKSTASHGVLGRNCALTSSSRIGPPSREEQIRGKKYPERNAHGVLHRRGRRARRPKALDERSDE